MNECVREERKMSRDQDKKVGGLKLRKTEVTLRVRCKWRPQISLFYCYRIVREVRAYKDIRVYINCFNDDSLSFKFWVLVYLKFPGQQKTTCLDTFVYISTTLY